MHPPPPKTGLVCATWNVHRGRGADGRIDPGRVLTALEDDFRDTAPQVLVLTEADEERPPYAGFLDTVGIERATGLVHANPATARWGADSHGFLGTILFLSPAISVQDAAVIDLPGHYPRGAVVLDARSDTASFRIVATHLSLAQVLRAAQMRAIGQHLSRRTRLPTIVMGDLNEWRPWGGLAFSRAVVGLRLAGPALPTFPARRPLLPLDRILCDRPGAVSDARVLTSGRLRAASDHLPLAARVTLDP